MLRRDFNFEVPLLRECIGGDARRSEVEVAAESKGKGETEELYLIHCRLQ